MSAERKRMLGIALLWAGAQLPLWLSAPAPDLACWRSTAAALRRGVGLYGAESCWSEGPVWAVALAAMDAGSQLLRLPAAWVFKAPAALSGLAAALLMFACLHRLAGPTLDPPLARRVFWGSAAVAAFPLQALVGAGWGHPESLALLAVLAAAWHSEFSSHPRADLNAALWLGWAASLKGWTALLLPLFLLGLPMRRERIRFAGWSLGLPLLWLLPFAVQEGAGAVWGRMTAPDPGWSLGLGQALRGFFLAASAPEGAYQALAAIWRPAAYAALLVLSLAALLSPWKPPLLPSLSLGALTLCLIPPDFPISRLVWLLPLALFLPGRAALRQGLAALGAALICLWLLWPGALWGGEAHRLDRLPAAAQIAWASLNLGLWIFLAAEWRRCLNFCLASRGRLGLEGWR